MLITRGFGPSSSEGGPGETIYVPICGTDMDITGVSSSRAKGREVLTKMNADSKKLTPVITSEVEKLTTIIDVTLLTPTIRSKE